MRPKFTHYAFVFESRYRPKIEFRKGESMEKNNPAWLPLVMLGTTINKGTFLDQQGIAQGMMMIGKNSSTGG